MNFIVIPSISIGCYSFYIPILILFFSLCTTLCLQWEPEVIAVALMYLAGKLSKFEVVDWQGRNAKHLRWWDVFVEDVTMDLLEGGFISSFDLRSSTSVMEKWWNFSQK